MTAPPPAPGPLPDPGRQRAKSGPFPDRLPSAETGTKLLPPADRLGPLRAARPRGEMTGHERTSGPPAERPRSARGSRGVPGGQICVRGSAAFPGLLTEFVGFVLG